MDLMEAIYTRRSIRKYKSDDVSKEIIKELLEAAVQAPSAMNSQPWAFAVIQDLQLLKNYSDRAKEFLLSMANENEALQHYKQTLSKPDFNIFYNANTLVVIYANPKGAYSEVDCCLAAQNFMLAAHNSGLGTCWIGFSLPLLNLEQTKKELGIPLNYVAVAPLVLGYPAVNPPGLHRKPLEILTWK